MTIAPSSAGFSKGEAATMTVWWMMKYGKIAAVR